MLSQALVDRIKARLADDWRRTGDGDWLRTPKELRRRQESPTIVGGLLGSMLDAIGSYQPEQQELKPIEPLAPKAIEKVEKGLGFRLPAELRQLYLEVGDGGFGPFNGIRRLANWAKDYAKLRSEPIGEKQREWPVALLPIVYLNGQRICVDKDSGAVIRWTKPPKRCSEAKWAASFAPQAASVGEWLEAWVDTPTECEGGPPGGWTPSTAEAERRERAEADKEAKAAAALDKARSFAAAELPPLPDALVEQVRARAMDPARRTYMAAAAAGATPLDVADLEEELARNADVLPPQALTGLSGMLGMIGRFAPLVNGRLSMVAGGGGGMMMMKSGAGGRLGQPATEAALAHADAQLGFRLAEPLRQLYRIADGGFGPGDTGLFSLAELIRRYRKLTAKPQGPSGEPWPGRLLPLHESDPALACLDVESGKIIVYDPSRMEDIHGGYWRRSFVTEQESLAALMEGWLGQPTFADEEARRRKREQERAARNQRRMENMDPNSAAADVVETIIAHYRKAGPEARADHGLPEEGWEDEVRRLYGGL